MRNITKSIALFVVCAFILPFCIVFASATGFESVAETSTKTTDSTENASTTPNENLNASQAGQILPDCKNITAIIASNVVPLEEYAQISFESNSVTSYTFEVENVKILQSTETQITFQLQSNSKFGSIHVTATFEDGGTAIETVYLYKENDLVFVSNLGLDDAFRKAMQYHYDQGLISKAEWETAYSEFIKAYIYCIDFDDYLTNNNEVIIRFHNN